MIEQIGKELRRLEREHNIKILYAVESGSRTWGFASTDSDWDVLFCETLAEVLGPKSQEII